jgi:hypothetical protein
MVPSPEGTLFDTLAGAADPSLVDFQIDTFHAYHGGADPAQLIAKHKGRVRSLHLYEGESTDPLTHIPQSVQFLERRPVPGALQALGPPPTKPLQPAAEQSGAPDEVFGLADWHGPNEAGDSEVVRAQAQH